MHALGQSVTPSTRRSSGSRATEKDPLALTRKENSLGFGNVAAKMGIIRGLGTFPPQTFARL